MIFFQEVDFDTNPDFSNYPVSNNAVVRIEIPECRVPQRPQARFCKCGKPGTDGPVEGAARFVCATGINLNWFVRSHTPITSRLNCGGKRYRVRSRTVILSTVIWSMFSCW